MNPFLPVFSEIGRPAQLDEAVATLVDLVLARGAATPAEGVPGSPTPAESAYSFLTSDGLRSRLTYAGLARRAQAIGATLQRVAAPGDRALLLYPPGLAYVEAFFGCLFAGVIAVPAYPPRPNRRDQRLEAIIADAGAEVMLVSSDLAAQIPALAAQYPAIGDLRWIASDLVNDRMAAAWQAPAIEGDTLAFLQYTSGSTSNPRGVMVSHANLLHNSALIAEAFGTSPDDRCLIWLPPYHDMGLIGGILQPLYMKFPVLLIDPMTFLHQPLRWLRLISDEGITLTGGPNFAYDLCAAKARPELLEGLDLSRWRVAFNGAEPIRAASLAQFSAAFADCGFRPSMFLPCYGLAEATLLVSGCRPIAEPVRLEVDSAALGRHRVEPRPGGLPLIGSGIIPGEQRVAIVDADLGVERGPGEVGEIWINSGSVAGGYWNNPAASAATFGARLPDGEGPFLRTGDLGFIQDGELFVTGRVKDLIIIDGRNHYPQDIELTVEEASGSIRKGGVAVFAIDHEDHEALVVVAELRRPRDAEAATAAVRRLVQERHDLAIHEIAWVRPGQVPKTSSGKIRRRECRARYLAGSLHALEGDS